MNPPVLRVNELRRRAAILQTDVFHVIRHDAMEQHEPRPEADGGRREEILPAAREVVS
jgi:hypothetical protein